MQSESRELVAKDLSEGVRAPTIGRNKSGKPWKKSNSTRSNASNTFLRHIRSWEEREDDRKKRASLKARMAELTAARIQSKKR